MNVSCSICNENFTGNFPEVLHSTSCGHVYHQNCLTEWLKRSKTCPECRTAVATGKTIRLFFQSNNVPVKDIRSLENEIRDLKNQLQKRSEHASEANAVNKDLRLRLLKRDEEIKTYEAVVNALHDRIDVLETRIVSLAEEPAEADDLLYTVQLNERDLQSVEVKRIVQEVQGDLFSAGEDYSFVHGVAEDFDMRAGIAVQFREKFGGTAELLDQRKTVGEVAYLKQGKRYVFYLITKTHCHVKPTIHALKQALQELTNLCADLNVKKLAMPFIGCAPGVLDWQEVKKTVNIVFQHSNITIDAYYLTQPVLMNSCIEMKYPLKVLESVHLLKNINEHVHNAAMIVYGSRDGAVDRANEMLNTKYQFKNKFANACRDYTVGEFVPIHVHNDLVCVFIVKNTRTAPFQFSKLKQCITRFSKYLEKVIRYPHVAIERITDNEDPLINDKIITVFREHLTTTVKLHICSSPIPATATLSAWHLN